MQVNLVKPDTTVHNVTEKADILKVNLTMDHEPILIHAVALVFLLWTVVVYSENRGDKGSMIQTCGCGSS